MNLCLTCQIETSNPSYCSKSCSAKRTNSLYPKRKKVGPPKPKRQPKWESLTIADLKAEGNANRGGRYPMIRQWSRRWYIRSGRPMECAVCGYDKHVDICHIKDVRFFPETALVIEVNDLDNLIALCKNHHWEFDNGWLCDPSAGLPAVLGKTRVGVMRL